jgi:hypothetical protein
MAALNRGPALQVSGLGKSCDRETVLAGIDFSVPSERLPRE